MRDSQDESRISYIVVKTTIMTGRNNAVPGEVLGKDFLSQFKTEDDVMMLNLTYITHSDH